VNPTVTPVVTIERLIHTLEYLYYKCDRFWHLRSHRIGRKTVDDLRALARKLFDNAGFQPDISYYRVRHNIAPLIGGELGNRRSPLQLQVMNQSLEKKSAEINALSRDAWNLSGKTALVTGASGGLGAHFAEVLASAGAEVILSARHQKELLAVAERIRAIGSRCTSMTLDVTDSSSIASARARFEQIDILINNAGIVREAGALELSEADWDAVLDTNLKGMFLMAQAVAKAMRAHGRGGSIVNIASILAARQAAGVLSYAVSKAGAIQLTKTLALELARFHIRVNALAPGYLNTELNNDFCKSDAGLAMIRRIPQRRLGTLEDLDGPLLLLASNASAYMTGAVLNVDGGHLVSTL
jgi:NAD(P)-dependent dehydrogenase (short-subunit alcohol dehydrogenase family)